MRIQHPASLQSPLLFLAFPLTVGTALGLFFFPSFEPYRNILFLLLSMCSLGLFWVQHKISKDPFSINHQEIFRGIAFLGILDFSLVHALDAKESLLPPLENGVYTFQAVVLEYPQEKEKTYRILVQPKNYDHQFQLYFRKDGRSKNLRPGDFVGVQAKVQVPQNFSKDFDYPHYLQTKDITMTGFVESSNWERCTSFPLSYYRELSLQAQTLRMKLEERLGNLFSSQKDKALIQAMLLGDKSELTQEQKNAYQTVGLSHLLALSGMHLSFITFLLGCITSWIPLAFRRLLMVTGTWAFIFLVGMPVSAIRAGVMLSLLLLNPFPHQRTSALDRWALAFILLLVIHPYILLDVGFQLSFAAVAGILLLSPYFPGIPHLPKFLQDGIQLCLSAQIAVLPLSLYHFGTLPLYFLLSNLSVSLIFTPVVMYLSIGLLIIGNSSFLSTGLKYLLEQILKLQQVFISTIQELPGAQIYITNFKEGALFMAYIQLFFLLKLLRKRNSKNFIHWQLSVIGMLLCMLFEI